MGDASPSREISGGRPLKIWYFSIFLLTRVKIVVVKLYIRTTFRGGSKMRFKFIATLSISHQRGVFGVLLNIRCIYCLILSMLLLSRINFGYLNDRLGRVLCWEQLSHGLSFCISKSLKNGHYLRIVLAQFLRSMQSLKCE